MCSLFGMSRFSLCINSIAHPPPLTLHFVNRLIQACSTDKEYTVNGSDKRIHSLLLLFHCRLRATPFTLKACAKDRPPLKQQVSRPGPLTAPGHRLIVRGRLQVLQTFLIGCLAVGGRTILLLALGLGGGRWHGHAAATSASRRRALCHAQLKTIIGKRPFRRRIAPKWCGT